MAGLQHVLGVVFLVTAVTGCSLLDLLMGVPPFDPDSPFPFPSAAATFNSGSASIVIDGRTTVLDELVGDASIQPDFGAKITWTDGDGLFLSFYSYGEEPGLPSSSYLSMDRVFDNQHWVVYNPERCLTTADRIDATGVAGSAICRGLEWSDYFSTGSITGLPEEIEGEPPFDAEITFEAH